MNLVCAEEAYIRCSEGGGDMAFSLYYYCIPVLLAFSRTVNCPSPYTVGLLPVVLDWWPFRYTAGPPYTVGLLPIYC